LYEPSQKENFFLGKEFKQSRAVNEQFVAPNGTTAEVELLQQLFVYLLLPFTAVWQTLGQLKTFPGLSIELRDQEIFV